MGGGSVLGQVGLDKAGGGGGGAALEVPAGKSSPNTAASGPKAGVSQGIIAGTSSEAGLEQAAALVRILDTAALGPIF